MPLVKSQDEKSEAHIALQPQSLEKNSIQLIMAHDLAGYGTGEIAQALGMTPGRISIIKGSPLYKEERARRFESLKKQIIDGKVEQILQDPVREHLEAHKLVAAKKLTALVTDAKNEFLQKSAAVDVLEFGGITKKLQNDKEHHTTIVLEEKIAERFGFAKGYEPPSSTTIERKLTIEST